MRTVNCGQRTAALRSKPRAKSKQQRAEFKDAPQSLLFGICFLVFALIPLVLVLACGSHSLVRSVSADDFALVSEGRYQGTVRVMNGDPQLKQLAQSWRGQIEADPVFLRDIAGRFFSLPDTTEFRFMYVGEDSVARRVILRYFGFAPKPFIIAGWQVQFVFEEQSRRLRAVYTLEVPLE